MRALNMQAFGEAAERRWPGITIYGIGDKAHQGRKSGHNVDDLKGSIPELEDADNKQEYRALDLMVRGPFTKADADALVARLLADPTARVRLYYIIWNGYIYSRSNGWKKTKYNGDDQHKDHVHVSGWAADDDNTASWPAVGGGGKGGVSDLFCSKGEDSEAVGALQVRLKNLGFYTGEVDDDYGAKTVAALRAACKTANSSTTANGEHYDKYTMYYVDMLLIQKYAGKPGPAGPPGKQGPQGPPGELTLPATLVFKGTVEQGS